MGQPKSGQTEFGLKWASPNQDKSGDDFFLSFAQNIQLLSMFFSGTSWDTRILNSIKNLWNLQRRSDHGLITFHTSAMSAIWWYRFKPYSFFPDLGWPISSQNHFFPIWAGPFQVKIIFSWFGLAHFKPNWENSREAWEKLLFLGGLLCFLPLSIDLGPPHAYRIPLLQKKIGLFDLL